MEQRFEEFQRGNHCGHVSYEELEKACFGYMHNIAALKRELDELQEELHQKLMYSGGEISRLEADNALLMKRLENFKKLWEWMRFTDKYHFCEDNGIRIEDMELKEG